MKKVDESDILNEKEVELHKWGRAMINDARGKLRLDEIQIACVLNCLVSEILADFNKRYFDKWD